MISEIMYFEYLSSLLDGNKAKCAAIIDNLLENKTEPKEIYKDLFQESLYEIGKMWERDNICGAKEHLATTITECMMGIIYSKFSGMPRNDKKVVVACAPKEFHDIGARIVSDIFEINGWNSYLLGANNQKSEVCKLLAEKKPHILALSLGIYINILRLLELIDEVKQKYQQTKIIVGGYAFIDNGIEALNKYPDIEYIQDVDELDKFIKHFEVPVV